MAGAGDLYALAQEFLTAVAEGVALSPAGPIPYQAISPGSPAYDCVPAIYVFLGGPSVADTYPLQPPMQPGHRVKVTGQVNVVSLTATILRCAPKPLSRGQNTLPPSAAQVSAAAAETYGDLWSVWNYLKNQFREGKLFTSPSGTREFWFDPAVPILIQGGACGWNLNFRVQLGGY